MIKEILISSGHGLPMESLKEVQALAGQGLVGDRNFIRKLGQAPDKNVTLIEWEKIDQFSAATGLEFSTHNARRNIVTQGVDLKALLNREFYVGEVKVEALELCEPCSLLARRTHRAVLWGLKHKGGLRCRIITSGIIRVGDAVTP